MSGGEGSVTCEEDGKWSAQSAFCVMTCPNPEIPEHSVPLAESNCIGSKRTFSPGVSCKFRCKPGYRVKDRDDPGRRILKKRCTKSGRWTQPRCEPIVCPELTANLLMWYNCSDGNSLGSVCTNHCPGEEVRFTFLLFNSCVSSGWIVLKLSKQIFVSNLRGNAILISHALNHTKLLAYATSSATFVLRVVFKYS